MKKIITLIIAFSIIPTLVSANFDKTQYNDNDIVSFQATNPIDYIYTAPESISDTVLCAIEYGTTGATDQLTQILPNVSEDKIQCYDAPATSMNTSPNGSIEWSSIKEYGETWLWYEPDENLDNCAGSYDDCFNNAGIGEIVSSGVVIFGTQFTPYSAQVSTALVSGVTDFGTYFFGILAVVIGFGVAYLVFRIGWHWIKNSLNGGVHGRMKRRKDLDMNPRGDDMFGGEW